jgi:kynureninase
MPASWKEHFSRFAGAAPGRLHFAAHSHHPWPDASFDAQQQAWLDAARHADLKWDRVFDEVLPAARRHLARQLRLPDPETLAFATNTHEFLLRLLSCLPPRARVLATDGEFHSFSRQLQRLEEAGALSVERVPVEPFDSFAERYAAAAARGGHHLAWFSQCFYNTGFRVADPPALVAAVRDPETLVVIDGYHAFMALPVDLSAVAGRAFFTAGGYKYAMAGEGACFLHCPPGYAARPVNTGWFAAFGRLAAAPAGSVPYAEGGARFFGATFDPTAWYRFNAVQDWLAREGITVAAIRAHVESLQARFLDRRGASFLADAELLPPPGLARGNFLAFRHPRAAAWHRRLLDAGILTDCRADRLRIGFGPHLDASDVDAFFGRAG